MDDNRKLEIEKELNGSSAQDKIFSLLFDSEEITWQSIIYDLMKKGDMNPWDIDVSVISKGYVHKIKELQASHDFRLSGKVLLAAAILLKIKSDRLLGEDMAYFDSLLHDAEEDEESLLFEENNVSIDGDEIPQLIPRTPQPRQRKVNIYDLVNALEQALEVKKRRVMANIPPDPIGPPKKTKNISVIVTDVYDRIKTFFASNNKRLTFSQLIPSDSREDKVYTFIPLLHLSNQRKVKINQFQNFGEIEIVLRQADKEVDKELGISS